MRHAGVMTPQSFDVVCIGRVGVDLYPMDTGVGLEDVRTLSLIHI